MSKYAERHLMKAIRDAEAAYDWVIDYRLVDQQEVGSFDVQYEYRLEIDGQYAEDEAARWFNNYATFDAVNEEYTDYSFAEIAVFITDM